MRRFCLLFLLFCLASPSFANAQPSAPPRVITPFQPVQDGSEERSVEAAQAIIAPQTGDIIHGVTATNTLVRFSSNAPNVLLSNRAITGLQTGETITGIDFRPLTRQLLAVGSTSRLYVIDTNTGAATQIGTGQFATLLSGTNFGVDFNPTVDRVRVVSNTGQNLRLNPLTGALVLVDTPLVYAAGDPNVGATPNVTAAAYTNNFNGSTTTTLFDIDTNLDILVRQGSPGGTPTSPNTGQLFTVGALGVNATNNTDLDIAPGSDVAYAATVPMGQTVSRLYRVNLTTGAASEIGLIGGNVALTGLSVEPRVATVYGVTGANQLVQFASDAPGTIVSSVAIFGLQGGESVLGIDFRPATGQLYALGSTSRLYTINLGTGQATQVGSGQFATLLAGTEFGFDFNPTVDRIRVVSNTGQNLRLHPVTGAIAGVDTPLDYPAGDPNDAATPSVVGSAYTNNFSGAVTTTLYSIDQGLDILASQGSINSSPISPNTGQTLTIGALGFDTTAFTGFDIASQDAVAYASLTAPAASQSQLATINLLTGTASLRGLIGGATLRDIAVTIAPIQETFFGVTPTNDLITFRSDSPSVILSSVTITGLQGGENIVGIDVRPATGDLVGLGSTSRLYTINRTTGVATQIGAGTFTPALTGTDYGADFNPVPDRFRVVSNSGQNFRLVPGTAVNTADTPLDYPAGDPNDAATPNVVAAGYTNSANGATTTTLFVIDSNLDILARQGSPGGSPISPNMGQLFTIGALGVNTTDLANLDIAPISGIAYATLSPMGGTGSSLYAINLNSGAATLLGAIGAGTTFLRAMCVANVVAADLTVTKTDAPDPVTTPGNITYTITATNCGPNTPASVTINDVLPAGTTFVSATPSMGGTAVTQPAPGATGTVTYSYPATAPGSAHTLTLVVATSCTLVNGAIISNTATVSSPMMDTNMADNMATAMTTVIAGAPAITCPANITTTASVIDPMNCTIGTNVNYTTPVATGACAATVACVPASSSFFPVGTTTVTCTATTGGGAMASCSFTVTVDATDAGGGRCYVDDATGDSFFQVVDPKSPIYRYWQYTHVASGRVFCGTADSLTYQVNRSHVSSDRDVNLSMSCNANLGARTATVQLLITSTNERFTLKDRNTANSGPCF